MSELRDWITASLYASGIEPTEESITPLEKLALGETGGDPNFEHENGACGLFALHWDTWEAFNLGGDIFDPVANGVACIGYQLGTFGFLVGGNDEP